MDHLTMPTAAPRLCPGCGKIVARGRCPRCTSSIAARVDAHRGTSASRGYDRHWRQGTRRDFLSRNPLCCLCKRRLASVPDHWPETRRSLVERGVPDPDADYRLRPLCKKCHDKHGLKG